MFGLRACFKSPDFERLPAKGSAGASPYRGAFGRARLLPSQRATKMRLFKKALSAPKPIPMTPESMSLNHVWAGVSKTAFPAKAVAGLTFVVGLLFAIEAAAANVSANPGFETPGLAGGTAFGPNDYSEKTATSPPFLFPGTVTNPVLSLAAPTVPADVRYQVVLAQAPDNANDSVDFDDLALNQTAGTTPPASQWNIVWSDEFNGTSIDATKWTFETGNGGSNPGWGNAELEYYTGRTNNAYVSNGGLHIVAREESMAGFSFTSARMKTQGLYNTPVYGRVEWRAAMPAGVGMWPGLWMLGSDFPVAGWPNCGEIDVAETKGTELTQVHGSLHSGSDETGVYTFSGNSITNFHSYMVDWESNSISFSVDGQVYETQTSWTSPTGPFPSPFNAPFFLLMNLAVGGNFVGYPSVDAIEAGTVFPAEILVDYVRVLERTAPLQIAAARSGGGVVLTWPTNIVCHLQVRTNFLSGGNWSDLANTTNPVIIMPGQNNACLFYRLESP